MADVIPLPEVKMNTLFDALFAPLSRRDDPLLLLADGGSLTGQAFLTLVNRNAQALRAAGVMPGIFRRSSLR